jgi:hypothetical protein
MDCIDLAQDMDRWRPVVFGAANVRVPYSAGTFLSNRSPVSLAARTMRHGVSQPEICRKESAGKPKRITKDCIKTY